MNISINSEIDHIKSIIIHEPNYEQKYVMPKHLIEWLPGDNKLKHNPNYLLLDDLLNPKKIQEEHQQLSKVLEYFTGKENCLNLITLLSEILQEEHIRNSFIEECISLEESNYDFIFQEHNKQQIKSFSVPHLIFTILTGRSFNNKNIKIFQNPIPNLMFTRDIAVVIGKTLILTWGKRQVRRRENIIAKYIFTYHPFFLKINIYNFHDHHPNLNLEGGDIIVFNEKIICIGLSERTSKESINALLPIIFEEGFNKVYAIDLPKQRSIMHLDTIFNRINNNEVIIFPPIFDSTHLKYVNSKIYCITASQCFEESIISKKDLISLLKENNIKIKTINCGGKEEHNQIREQWTEGANFFTIKPGTIIGYDINTFTIEALVKAGYIHIDSKDFLLKPDNYKNIKKLIISIPGAELSRGRGGTRCLTLPLMREKYE